MLGFIFGFNARLGRLHYFLAAIGLGIAMLVVLIAITAATAHGDPRQMLAAFSTWPVVLTVIFFIWVSFMLQAMRLRDIGWDPVCVIPVWIAVMIVDHVAAIKIPAWSLTAAHSGTVVGALVNAGLGLALLFWPSGQGDDQAPTGRSYDPPPRQRVPASPLAARIARLNGR